MVDLWEASQIRKKAEELSAWYEDTIQCPGFSKVLDEMESLASSADTYYNKCAYVNLVTGKSGWCVEDELESADFLIYQHTEDSNFLEAAIRAEKPAVWGISELHLLDAKWHEAEEAYRSRNLAAQEPEEQPKASKKRKESSQC